MYMYKQMLRWRREVKQDEVRNRIITEKLTQPDYPHSEMFYAGLPHRTCHSLDRHGRVVMFSKVTLLPQ